MPYREISETIATLSVDIDISLRFHNGFQIAAFIPFFIPLLNAV